jgi:hypothetical protein
MLIYEYVNSYIFQGIIAINLSCYFHYTMPNIFLLFVRTLYLKRYVWHGVKYAFHI